MKSNLLLVLGAIALFLAACKKNDNDNVHLEAHDSDRMMDSMHVMMSRMDTMHMTGDPDVDFTTMMMMHHEGAIGMANAELQSGQNDSLKRTAQRIVTEQQAEIRELAAILASLHVDNSDAAFQTEQKTTMDKMGMTADVQLITGDIDNDFATLMVVHHQAAIDNALSYLHHGDNAALRTMASNMADAQGKEIIELSSWLKDYKR